MNPGAASAPPKPPGRWVKGLFSSPRGAEGRAGGWAPGGGGAGCAGPPGCNERQTGEFRGGVWGVRGWVEGKQLAEVVEDLNPGGGGWGTLNQVR